MRKSKAKRILSYLLKGRKLTPLQALKKFGVYRLSSVIHRLRQQGYNVEDVREKEDIYSVYQIVR